MPFNAGQKLTAAELNANVPQLLGSTILTGLAAAITIAIPSGFNHLRGVVTGRQDSGSGGAFAFIQFNGDAGANYTYETFVAQTSTATAANSGGAENGIRVAVLPGSGDSANYFGTAEFVIGNCSSSVYKPLSASYTGALSLTNAATGTAGGIWQSTAAITSVSFMPFTGNLVAGSSMSIYGWQ